MITVFLCDDSPKEIDKYNKLITQIAKKHRIEINLFNFRSGESLIYYLSDSPDLPDIIYLDILMRPMNGLETAKQLKKHGCKAELIFLTFSEDYVFDSFDVMPIQYLLKEATSVFKFEQVFLRAASMVENKKTDMFICESGNARKIIPLKDISYFKIWQRIVTVHYQEKEIFEYYDTMENLEKQLQDRDFIRTHRSYLVNLPYISKFQNQNLLLKTGEKIPIGVTYREKVKNQFTDYVSRNSIHYVHI